MILLSAISASPQLAGRYVERHVMDVENAQEIRAALTGRNELADASLSGEPAGYRWRLNAEPLKADIVGPRAQTRCTRGPSGPSSSFDMIRFVRDGK
jgi:hypothetical protein